MGISLFISLFVPKQTNEQTYAWHLAHKALAASRDHGKRVRCPANFPIGENSAGLMLSLGSIAMPKHPLKRL